MITGPEEVPSDWNSHAKPALTRRDVERIQARVLLTPITRAGQHRTARGNTIRALANSYGVSTMTIYRALRPGYLPTRCRHCGSQLK